MPTVRPDTPARHSALRRRLPLIGLIAFAALRRRRMRQHGRNRPAARRPVRPDDQQRRPPRRARPRHDHRGQLRSREGERALRRPAGGPRRPEPSRHQLRLAAGDRLPGHVHAGRFRARRDRVHPGEERDAHDEHELHGLCHRHHRVLPRRLRDRLRRSRNGRGEQPRRSRPAQQRDRDHDRRHALGHPGRHGLRADRLRLRRRRHRVLPVPARVHGHDRHDPDRLDGRALAVQAIRHLRPVHLGDPVPVLRQLGVGRRLPQPARRAGARSRLR